MSKKLVALALILALALTCAVALIISPVRIAQGEVTSRTYIEHADYMNTFFTTTDGEQWVAEGYTAPIGDKVLIIYDRCDKSTIYDDEIMHIIHFTDFTK
jgi:hypothetical protein